MSRSLDVHDLDDGGIANAVQGHNGVAPLAVLQLLGHQDRRLQDNRTHWNCPDNAVFSTVSGDQSVQPRPPMLLIWVYPKCGFKTGLVQGG